MKRAVKNESDLEGMMKTFKIHYEDAMESLLITEGTPIEQIERTVKAMFSLDSPGPLLFSDSQGITVVFTNTLPEGFDLFIKNRHPIKPSEEVKEPPAIPKITLIIKPTFKDEFNIEVDPSANVDEVLKEIERQKPGITRYKRLIFGDKTLLEGKTLADYGVNKSAILRLMLKPQYTKRVITVLTKGGKKVRVKTQLGATAWKVKCVVATKEGIPIEAQKLFYKGKELQDNQELSEIGVNNGDIFRLVTESIPTKKVRQNKRHYSEKERDPQGRDETLLWIHRAGECQNFGRLSCGGWVFDALFTEIIIMILKSFQICV
eukprot:TRINITY_DN42116_c0_g1_i1.p1 TRINITY_DN42116_c0_g1~~TRINITY_DN42116_c0_g1_i1.p1  ORF type:complete len:319 (+),score=27.49 TRINITY_DN42116_c0_g1_i1:372-1328(+)